MFTVGPVQENCFVARRDGSDRALIVDPGDEADRILAAVDELGVGVDAILLTHTHFDHVGAVAPVARATGAPVYCPELETFVLADINGFVPFAGLRPVRGLRRRRDRRRRRAPAARGHGHRRPAHAGAQPGPRDLRDRATRTRCSPATCSSRARSGASTCPAATGTTLLASIDTLLDRFRDETTVYPGHMGITTLGRERATNPFLRELAAVLSERIQAPRGTFDVLPAGRGARATGSSARGAAHPRRAPAIGGSRRRSSRPPSCSPAAWARPPTSCRRRCTRSTTAAGGR